MDERFHVGRDTAVLESVVHESLVPAASRRGQAIGELLRGRLAGLTIVHEPWFGGQFLIRQFAPGNSSTGSGSSWLV